MTYTVISMTEMDIYVVGDRIVGQSRPRCCRMAITIYQRLVKLFPPTRQRHHLITASTNVPIIRWPMSLIEVDPHLKTNPRLDASLLQCILRSQKVLAIGPGEGTECNSIH